jgi:very-short-patch-repair endonuclease
MSLGYSREKRVSPDKRDMARRFRKEPTEAESALWQALRGRKLGGLKFRREQPLLGYVVDFYCEERNLAVEVDGSVHDSFDAKQYDADRDAALHAAGVRVLRLKNKAVMGDLDGVLKTILNF